ncbi:MAG: hypothetical protein ACE5FH_11525, partial [Candidatus Zixiibacteriota bacterium]
MLACVVCLTLCPPATAQFQLVWVATTGSDITGDGSFANPFLTIAKGLSVAGGLDTVVVAPGLRLRQRLLPVRAAT